MDWGRAPLPRASGEAAGEGGRCFPGRGRREGARAGSVRFTWDQPLASIVGEFNGIDTAEVAQEVLLVEVPAAPQASPLEVLGEQGVPLQAPLGQEPHHGPHAAPAAASPPHAAACAAPRRSFPAAPSPAAASPPPLPPLLWLWWFFFSQPWQRGVRHSAASWSRWLLPASLSSWSSAAARPGSGLAPPPVHSLLGRRGTHTHIRLSRGTVTSAATRTRSPRRGFAGGRTHSPLRGAFRGRTRWALGGAAGERVSRRSGGRTGPARPSEPCLVAAGGQVLPRGGEGEGSAPEPRPARPPWGDAPEGGWGEK